VTGVSCLSNEGAIGAFTNEGNAPLNLTHLLNRLLEKKGRRQQFYDSWHPRYFVVKHGVVEHWRSKEVRIYAMLSYDLNFQ
jgi:hypothetical protein